MSFADTLRYWYLAFVSRPAADRILYQKVKARRPGHIVEVGVGSLERTLRLVRLASKLRGGEVIYGAIDAFDLRPPNLPAVGLKAAFQLLRACGAQARLQPGDLYSALSQRLHLFRHPDLLLIAEVIKDEELARAGHCLPALLHEKTEVWREITAADGSRAWQPVKHEVLHELSRPVFGRRAA